MVFYHCRPWWIEKNCSRHFQDFLQNQKNKKKKTETETETETEKEKDAFCVTIFEPIEVQGIPVFRDFTNRDSRYFVILFHWKSAKKVDFRIFLKYGF